MLFSNPKLAWVRAQTQAQLTSKSSPFDECDTSAPCSGIVRHLCPSPLEKVISGTVPVYLGMVWTRSGSTRDRNHCAQTRKCVLVTCGVWPTHEIQTKTWLYVMLKAQKMVVSKVKNRMHSNKEHREWMCSTQVQRNWTVANVNNWQTFCNTHTDLLSNYITSSHLENQFQF